MPLLTFFSHKFSLLGTAIYTKIFERFPNYLAACLYLSANRNIYRPLSVSLGYFINISQPHLEFFQSCNYLCKWKNLEDVF